MLFKKIKYLVDIVIVFLFFYGIFFNAIPISTSKLALIYIFIFFPKKSLFSDFLKIKILGYSLFVWIIISTYYLFLSSLNPRSSLNFFVQTAWYFGEGVFGSYFLYRYLIFSYGVLGSLILIRNVFLIQSIFIVLTFLNIDIRDRINDLLIINDNRYLNPFRMKGLANSGGAGLSYLQTVGVLICCILFLIENKSKAYKHILIAIFIIISQIFVARTGMIFSFILLIGTFLQKSINNGSIMLFIKIFIISIISINIVYIGVIELMPKEQADVFKEVVIGRAFEFIESYEETGDFSTQSTDHLLSEMYFLPNSPSGIIFGEGLWDDPPGTRDYLYRKVDSDVGYVRIIFAIGIIFSILFYSIYVYYLIELYNKDDLYILKFLLFLLAFIFVFGETKEPFLVRSSGIVKSLFLLFYVIFLNNIYLPNTNAYNK